MTADHHERDRERGHDTRGDGDHAFDGPRQPGIDWGRVVATVLALIVLAIATILLSTLG